MKIAAVPKTIGLLCLLLILTSSPAWSAFGTNWVEQWGIRWTFDKEISDNPADPGVTSGQKYLFGTYANNEYWIVGPVNITAINPPCSVVNSPTEGGGIFSGRVINGTMINPIPCNKQSYDSAASGWLSEFCVGLNISEQNPLFVDVSSTPIKSLVSTISKEVVPSKNSKPRVQTAAILTVVSSAPSSDAFRPPYAGNFKPAEIQKEDIHWEVLGNLPIVAHTPPLSESIDDFERPWLVHKGPYPAEVIQPIDSMPDYGRSVAREVSIASLQLNLDYTQQQKEPLLMSFLQYGIDVYGIAGCSETMVPQHCTYSPQRIWYGAGGIGIGKRTPFVFAARVFNHAGMINVLSKQGDYLWEQTDSDGYPQPYGPGKDNFPPDYIQFGEEQVFYVRQIHVDLTHNQAPSGWPSWSTDSRNEMSVRFDSSDIDLAEWGERSAENPHSVNNHWFIGYRGITGGAQVGSALALRLIGAIDICNHDAWFDYYDRYMNFIQQTDYTYVVNGSTKTPFADGKPWRFGVNGVDLYESDRFVWDMWDAYRNQSLPSSYTLTITALNGSVEKNPDEINYSPGQSVELTTEPNPGYTFANWTGDASGTDPTITVIMNSNKTIIANFISENPPNNNGLPDNCILEELEVQYFDGDQDYHSVSTAGFNLSGTMVTMWFKAESVTESHYLFGHTVGSWSSRIQLYVRDGVLGLGLGDNHRVNENIADINPGQWYFAAFSWDGSSYQVYVDDVLRASGNYSGLSQFSSIADFGNTGNPSSRTSEAFFGWIDDIRIYNRVLTSEETLYIYNYGMNNDMTAHWRLDDFSQTTAMDCSENQYTATLIGQPECGRSWANEEFIRLSKNNQAIQVPSETITPDSGSIAVWICPESTSSVQYIFSHVLNSSNRISLLTINGQLALSIGDQNLMKKNITALQPDEFAHFILTWDQGEYTLYQDGTTLDFGTYSGLSELRSSFDIGNYGDPQMRLLYFNGIIDDIRTYSRAITPEEAKELFQTFEVKENLLLSYSIRGTDLGGNPISYTAQNLPDGATFDTNSQTFTWQPWYNHAGNYTIQYSADGQDDLEVKVSVQETALQDWYRNFLEFNGKL